MKGIVILVKVWDVQNLEKSARHWLLVETWKWNWIIKVLAGAEIWFIALWFEAIQVQRSTDFMQNSHINVSSKQVLSKWNIFNMFGLRESCSKAQTYYIKHSWAHSCWCLLYLECIQRYCCRERIWYYNTYDTGARSSSEIQEKEMDKKSSKKVI